MLRPVSGMENDDSAVQYAIGRSDTVAPGVGIDLEFDADVQTMSPEASEYETCYVTSHKGPCRVASYSRDGQLIATGSADASIKILDTERMLAKSAMPIEVRQSDTRVCFLSSRLMFTVVFVLLHTSGDDERDGAAKHGESPRHSNTVRPCRRSHLPRLPSH